MYKQRRHAGGKSWGPVVLVIAAALAGCGTTATVERYEASPEEVSTLREGAKKIDQYWAWRVIRDARERALDQYLDRHAVERDAFLYRPLGNVGIPRLIFNTFPQLFPEYWGSANLEKVGLSANPYDETAALPLGLGSTIDPSTGLEVVTLSCAGCHMGRVRGPDGDILPLLGAPNTHFNQFRTAAELSVLNPKYDAAFAGTQLEPLAVGLKEKILQRRALIDATLGGYTFSPARFSNPPDLHTLSKPGHLDAIGVALVSMTVPEILQGDTSIVPRVMPAAPAQVDIPSVWRQGARDSAQWDGSVPNPVYRNLAAEVGVIGIPSAVDFENAKLTADLQDRLPPPPYPFDVHAGKALKGMLLYARYCASCHSSEGTTLFPASDVGTDPNRTVTVQQEGRDRLVAALQAACTDPAVCDVPDEEIVRNAEDTRGYLAGPLDGIWARAPYLHNGSVPTLYHLLVPASRPDTFIRGSVEYDEAKVGFAWDDAAAAEANTHYFDTTEDGGANIGHDTAAFNGRDWSRTPDDLEALLEFLKML